MQTFSNKTRTTAHIAYWEGKGWAVYNLGDEVNLFPSYEEAYCYWVETLSGDNY